MAFTFLTNEQHEQARKYLMLKEYRNRSILKKLKDLVSKVKMKWRLI